MNFMPLPTKHLTRWNGLGLLLLAVTLTGCDRGQIKVYQLSNNDSSSSSSTPLNATGAMPDQNVNSAAQPQLQWTVPADWHPVPPAQFLLAEYSITGADGTKAEVNVAQLAGSGGGVLANVNRWRGQIGLDPVDETGLARLTTTMAVTGGQATFVDMTGTDANGQPTRLVAAIVPMGDETWFYKLMGDEKVVASQKDAFTKFARTARYSNAP